MRAFFVSHISVSISSNSDKISSMKKHAFNTLLLMSSFCFLAFASQESKADLLVLDEFDFGTLVILNNSAPFTYRVDSDNNTTYNPSAFLPLSPPNRASINVSNGPPNTAFSVSVSAAPVLLNGAGPQFFTVTNVVTNPVTPFTNGSGSLNVRFDSTLRTSGDGTPYPNGNYTGNILITVDY